MKKMMGGLLGATLLLSAMPAAAAVVLKVNPQGKLLGATGVIIGKSTYNVDFADGSCASVYGSCAVDKFDFKTQAAAKEAADALLVQVLVGRYATAPGDVFGCGTFTCDTYIAYTLYDPDYAQVMVAANRGSGRKFTGTVYPGINSSTASDPAFNYARFTWQAVSAVPEPATWGMMLVGFGMVGAASRYRRRGAKITYA